MIASRPPALWRRRFLPVFFVLLAVNLATLVAYTFPRQMQLRTVTSRVALLRAEVEGEEERTAALRRSADAIRANTADMQRFYGEVVADRESALLPTIREVEQMIASPGLKSPRRAFHPEEVKGAPLTRVAISLPVEGTYSQLVQLLGGVERSPRFLTVDRVALRRSGAQKGDLSVELSAYFKAASGEGRGR